MNNLIPGRKTNRTINKLTYSHFEISLVYISLIYFPNLKIQKMIWISVSVLIICLPISMFLWQIILKYFSDKPLLSLTLVDLIYRDIIVCIFLTFVIYSTALTHVLTAGTDILTLSYEFSLLYVVILNFSTNVIYMLMILSGGLRFISLLKNSEAAGLQLLGVDSEALIIIRVASIFISLLIPGTTIPLYDAYPGIFRLLHEEKIKSNWEDIKVLSINDVTLFDSELLPSPTPQQWILKRPPS